MSELFDVNALAEMRLSQISTELQGLRKDRFKGWGILRFLGLVKPHSLREELLEKECRRKFRMLENGIVPAHL